MIWHLIKDAEFRDNPPNPHFAEGRPPNEQILTQYSTDQPEVHDVIAEMRRVIDGFDDRVLIGEIYLPLDRLVAYYGNDLAGAHLPFNFALISTLLERARDREDHCRLRKALPAGGWPNWVLGNHDRPRIASRVGPEQARVAAMLLLTLRGTPTMYYGDEIGMHQVAIAPGSGARPVREERAGHRRRPRWLPHADAMGRDGECRFSTAGPGCRWPEDHVRENVANLEADAARFSALYKASDRASRKLPQLVAGAYQPLAAQGDLLLYRREGEGRFGRSWRSISVPSRLRSLQRDRLRPRNPAVDIPRPRGRAVRGHARPARQ